MLGIRRLLLGPGIKHETRGSKEYCGQEKVSGFASYLQVIWSVGESLGQNAGTLVKDVVHDSVGGCQLFA